MINIAKPVFFTRLGYAPGKDRISGAIYFKNQAPASKCIINFYDQKSGYKLIEFRNDSDGYYDLNNIDLKKGPFFIVAHDPTGEHNAVIADNIGGPNYVDN